MVNAAVVWAYYKGFVSKDAKPLRPPKQTKEELLKALCAGDYKVHREAMTENGKIILAQVGPLFVILRGKTIEETLDDLETAQRFFAKYTKGLIVDENAHMELWHQEFSKLVAWAQSVWHKARLPETRFPKFIPMHQLTDKSHVAYTFSPDKDGRSKIELFIEGGIDKDSAVHEMAHAVAWQLAKPWEGKDHGPVFQKILHKLQKLAGIPIRKYTLEK
jgi:hypothetical protein